MVIVELIDFTYPCDELETSSNRDQYLFNLLKLKIRNNRHRKFSLQFESVGKLESLDSLNSNDVVVSEKHNVLVATHLSYIVIYNRLMNQSPILDKLVFKVDFTIRLRCLKLNTEMDQEFIYVSTADETIMKINLSKLLITRENSIVWKSQKFDNVWGIEILNNRVYAADFSRGIKVLDCESGKTLSDPKLPKIVNGFHLIFISPKEMVVSGNSCVGLFHLIEDTWELVRKTSFQIEYACTFYERDSQLIYVSDCNGMKGEKIKVLNMEDMSLVKSFGDFKFNFGICIDRLSGLLYVCDTDNYYIEVFK